MRYECYNGAETISDSTLLGLGKPQWREDGLERWQNPRKQEQQVDGSERQEKGKGLNLEFLVQFRGCKSPIWLDGRRSVQKAAYACKVFKETKFYFLQGRRKNSEESKCDNIL